MGKTSVFDDSKGLQVHLFAGAGDEYLTEAQYIRWDDMSADEIARIDALESDPDHEKENLVYKLAKIKASADDKVFATNTQIDGLFATCTPTPEPEPTPTGYTLVTSGEANSANAAVYSALVATIFMEGTKKNESVNVENITIDSNPPATYPVVLGTTGVISINNIYALDIDGKLGIM